LRLRDTSSRCSTRGFTLIELMVTMTVMAILLAIAIPSFSRTMSINRLVSQTNELVGGLNLARSEAIHRGQTVSIHSKSDTANFQTGWEVFTDADGSGSPAAPATAIDGTVIRTNPAITGSTTIHRVTRAGASPNFTYTVSSAADKGYVIYNARGGNASGVAFFRICDASSASTPGRIVQVSVVGKTSVDSTTAACP